MATLPIYDPFGTLLRYYFARGQGPPSIRIGRAIDILSSIFESEIRRILEQLSRESLVPGNVLADELEQYERELDHRAAGAEFFDLQAAKRVAALCHGLLAAMPGNPDEHQHRLTQVAINYFVLAEDAEDDNHSLIGFDDDLRVVTAVIEELGLNHLLEEAAPDG